MSETNEVIKSSRERRSPERFSDYEVTKTIASEGCDRSDSRKEASDKSRHSQVSGSSSQSRSSIFSRLSNRSVLSDEQVVHFKRVQSEKKLQELIVRQKEDELADEKIQELDEEAIRAQETARRVLKERERVQTEISRARKLRQAKHELHEASMIESMLSTPTHDSKSSPTPTPLAPNSSMYSPITSLPVTSALPRSSRLPVSVNTQIRSNTITTTSTHTVPSSQVTLPSSYVPASAEVTLPSSFVPASAEVTLPSSFGPSAAEVTLPSSYVPAFAQVTLPSSGVPASSKVTLPSSYLPRTSTQPVRSQALSTSEIPRHPTSSSLVGMLTSIEGDSSIELRCGSHVDKLLTKLPSYLQTNFIEYCLNHGILTHEAQSTYTLVHLNNWLQTKSRASRIAKQAVGSVRSDTRPQNHDHGFRPPRPQRPVSALNTVTKSDEPRSEPNAPKPAYTIYCAYCKGNHHIGFCDSFKPLKVPEVNSWIKNNKRCWKCARSHSPDDCNLKRPCNICQKLHLSILHDSIHQRSTHSLAVNQTPFYLDKSSPCDRVLLKVVPVILNGPRGDALETYAVLDDGSMRTMIMMPAIRKLRLQTEVDNILLTTIRSEPFHCVGHSVNFTISSRDDPERKYTISNAFASDDIALSKYSYPVKSIQSEYAHLQNAVLPDIDEAKPLILIGSDHADLILPQTPIRFGPSSVPVAVHTKLGWTLQGLSKTTPPSKIDVCLLNVVPSSSAQLASDVEKLWKAEVIPYTSKAVTRSKMDNLSVDLLESKTVKVVAGDTSHYATPLLRKPDCPHLHAGKELVMGNLRSVEKRLQRDPELANVHNQKIQELVDKDYVKIISETESASTPESWFIPHQYRLVFYSGQALNTHLFPDPNVCSPFLLNPADDITRGLTLNELSSPESRWRHGPSFLTDPPDEWPQGNVKHSEVPSEFKKTFCGVTAVSSDVTDHADWDSAIESVKSTMCTSDGAAAHELLRRIQRESFPDDLVALSTGKPHSSSSRLLQLNPEYEVEAILNSKPLGYVSSDVSDVDPITPFSLLIGRPDPSLPLVVYPADQRLGKSRWRHCQIVADQFWKKFIQFYLPILQLRDKWFKDGLELKVDDCVLIADNQQVRGLWPVGKIVEVCRSPDGRVRSAIVRVSGGDTYHRPVAKLVLLPEVPE